MARDDRRIEQHPDRNEEEHGEHVREGEDVGSCSVAYPRFADDRAREEGSQGERNIEDLSTRERDTDGRRQDRQRGQLG